MRPSAVVRFLGSWWSTAVLLLALAAGYLTLSLGQNPYPAWTAFLFRSVAGAVLYGALVLNLITASIRIARAKLRRRPVTEEGIRTMDAHCEIPLAGDRSQHRAAEWLQKHVAVRDVGGGGIRHITGSLSFIPGTVFRLGLVLTLSAVMVSVHVRKTYDTVLREGEQKEVLGAPLALAALSADLPEDFLQVGEDGSFLLENVAARITASGRTAAVTPGFPTRMNGSYFRIFHLGYSQLLAAAVAGHRDERTVDLDILPPGRTDIVSLASGKAFLTVSLEPERVIEKGLVKGRQYNLRVPRYRIVVQDGKAGGPPATGVLRPGGTAAIGPARLALGEQSRYVRVQIVRDPALPVLYGGMILLLAGLTTMISRFFWYEREFTALVSNGKILMGCRDEFFKKWGIGRFQRWKDELEALIRE